MFKNFFSLCSTVSVTEQMTAIRKRSETSVIGQIADDLLAWVRPFSRLKAGYSEMLAHLYDPRQLQERIY